MRAVAAGLSAATPTTPVRLWSGGGGGTEAGAGSGVETRRDVRGAGTSSGAGDGFGVAGLPGYAYGMVSRTLA